MRPCRHIHYSGQVTFPGAGSVSGIAVRPAGGAIIPCRWCCAAPNATLPLLFLGPSRGQTMHFRLPPACAFASSIAVVMRICFLISVLVDHLTNKRVFFSGLVLSALPPTPPIDLPCIYYRDRYPNAHTTTRLEPITTAGKHARYCLLLSKKFP